MKITRQILKGICVAAVFFFVAAAISTRPWRSAQSVRHLILSQTSLGSNEAEVKQFVQEQGWGVCLSFRGNTSSLRDTKYTGVTGYYIFGATLPQYGFPLRIHTEAYWGFDVNGKLIDVNVRRWSGGI